MRLRTMLALAAALSIAGCGLAPAEPPARGTAETCLPLWQEFDRLEEWTGDTPVDEGFVMPPMLERQGMRLLRAGCITRGRDLVLAPPPVPVVESGPRRSRIHVHAGAVPGLGPEWRLRRHFADQGIRMTSLGSPALGRRIFLGPFETEGGVAAAMEAARAAGFTAPYPRRTGGW
jgi:hypothetical protein